jgi:coenzyme Q-binding protein COQ10
VERYPEFLPWVTGVTIRERTPDSFIAEVTVGYKFLTETYSCRVRLTPHSRIDIDYLSGPFRHLNNHWAFEAHPDGTEVDFFIDFEFQSSMLQTMMNTVFSEAVKYMISSFESRAQEIHGK